MRQKTTRKRVKSALVANPEIPQNLGGGMQDKELAIAALGRLRTQYTGRPAGVIEGLIHKIKMLPD